MIMSANVVALVRSVLCEKLEQMAREIREAAGPLGEAEFWRKPVEPGNSVGHLVLHLTGNLNHFVGAQLGGTDYVRDREREFTEAAPPGKAEALNRLGEAVALFRRVVSGLGPERLTAPHPEERFRTVLKALVSLVAHFAVHRGQISYLVRLLKKANPENG
jgi:uncharacterized damage-inducible protein DinB